MSNTYLLDECKKKAFIYLKDKEAKPTNVGIYYRVDDVAKALDLSLESLLEKLTKQDEEKIIDLTMPR